MAAADASAPSGPASPTTTGRKKSAGPASRRPKRAAKYNAKGERVELHGKSVFIPSAAQAIRLRQLIELERSGRIGSLRAEVRYPVTINGMKVFDYRCDHVYDELDSRGCELRTIYEEVKGFITPEYRLKKKVFEAALQVKISEIMVNTRSAKALASWSEEWQNKLPD